MVAFPHRTASLKEGKCSMESSCLQNLLPRVLNLDEDSGTKMWTCSMVLMRGNPGESVICKQNSGISDTMVKGEQSNSLGLPW